MEASNSSKLDTSCEDVLRRFDPDKEALYEYKIRELFSRGTMRLDNENFDAELEFHVGLLKTQSFWEIKRLNQSDPASKKKEYSIYRKLEFFPMKETKNWSLTIDVSDNFATPKIDVMGPFKEYEGLTANHEKPFIEYEYTVRCERNSALFCDSDIDYYSNIKINVVKCTGLSAYMNPSVYFTKAFEGSNVILLTEKGARYFYSFELLAVHSSIFYKKWLNRNNLPVEDGHHVVDVEDTDVPGMINILKTILYKVNYLALDSVEDVAMAAKKWKFEMLLASCEDFFVKHLKETTLQKYTLLAHEYDMSLLQHILSLKQMDKDKKLKALEPPERKRRRHSESPVPYSDYLLKKIISSKFDLPEIRNSFSFNKNEPTPFKPGERTTLVAEMKRNEALVDWKFMWYWRPETVYLSIIIIIPTGIEDKRAFSSINWSLDAIFTITLNGRTMEFEEKFTPQSERYTFDTQMKAQNIDDLDFNVTVRIKSVRGLRFLVKDTILRSFDARTPSSDVVLQCDDKKLFANLNILSQFSLFFRGLKDYPDMNTMDETENLPVANMDDLKSELVLQILNYVYGINRSPLDGRYLEDMTIVADRFLFRDLRFECEKGLGAPAFPLGPRTLDFAIRYNLLILKENYLEQFRTVEQVQELKNQTSYDDLSETAKSLLFERMMSLPARR